MPPLVSVIIPTFNRWPLVGAAVESVLAQSFSNFELIVVDDGSADGTAAELARLGSRLQIFSTPRRGVSAARNTGVRQSFGRYIAFLDSDDLWRPRKLARQTAFMVEHPEVQICQTEEIWIRNGIRVNPKTTHRKPSGDIFVRSLDLCLVSPSTVMMRRELFQRLGGFDETFPVCEDYDLWLRIAAQEPVPLIAEALVVKRGGHADQLSRSTWGMDRYRVRALQKVLRAGIEGSRRAAALEVLRRKVGVLANGARKRGKWREADDYKALLCEFEQEIMDVRERDPRLRPGQGLSPANA
ncbi:MAG: glycosyltransferase family 2 protein [Candidatus Binatia bacterium]